MDTVGDYIVLNVLILIGLGIVGYFIGRKIDLKGFAAFYLFWVGLGISFWVWVIYVIVHFVTKHW